MVSPKASEPAITFLSAVDNTGIAKYVVTWSKDGNVEGTKETTETALTLD